MKGLMIKDFRLMRNQGNSLLILAVCGLMMTFTMAPAMAVGYMCALGVMLALGTLGYDEFEGGYTYLFTLPVTRREYVVEKYVISLLGGLAGALFGLILCLTVQTVKGGAGMISLPDLIITGDCTLCVICMLMAGIMIPVRLKFGSEKSRLVLFGVFAVIAGAAFILTSSKAILPKGLAEKLVSIAERSGTWTVFIVIALVSGAALVISERISEKIMEKKEY